MTYFELFDLPVQLKLNGPALSKRFFELSKKYHPDYFVTGDAEVQAEALEKSALLNKAWKTFQNPDETIKYVLQLKGLLEEEEKYELPPVFLMEVLEINEQLMEAGDDPAIKSTVETITKNLLVEIYEPVKKIVENYTEGITTEKELLQVKEYYYKKKYLDRLNRELSA